MFKIPSRIALFLSFLIVFTLGTYSISALSKFYDYKKRVSPNMELTVDRFHFFLKNEFKREWIKLTVSKPLNDEESALKTFRITIKQDDIDTLNADLPGSGKAQYVKAYLKTSIDTDIHKIKLRYRGDNNFHWLYEQKSMRIKLTGDDLYNMEKEFNLINHPNWYFHRDIISYNLAKQLGLITPDYFPCRVFINGQYKGIYLYLSQVNESLLRKHQVMPGSIYFGDFAQPNSEGVRNLWDKSSYWVKKSSRNAEQKNNREDIDFFIKAPYEIDDKKFFSIFSNQFDENKFINYIALDRLVGSGHHDYHHNHKIYFDPYKGKFEPIEWDVRVWSTINKKDISLYPLLLKLKKNPILDAKIDKKIYTLIENSIGRDIIKEIDHIHNQVKPDLASDQLKDNAIINVKFTHTWIWISTPFTLEEYSYWMESDKKLITSRIQQLQNLYNSIDVKYNIKEYDKNKFKLNIMVDGHTPVNIEFNDLVELKKKTHNYGDVSSVTLYPGRKFVKNIRKKGIATLGKDEVVNVPQFYEIYFKTDDIEVFMKQIKFTNFLTEKPISISQKAFDLDYDNDILHPWDFLTPPNKLEKISDVINVNETLIFDKYTTVQISPGTTFIMDSNISIYFYGKVEALGTKEKPIKFMAKDPNKPWGLIAVQGQATTGSIFEYVEFENGSIDTHNLIHYTSPFNIHDMDWFEVRNCKIGRNFVGDDAMHIAYAKGVVDNCEFTDARSDGLDIDISDVNITNNIFYNSGNDGLDVMTTSMNASNNIFIDMGDKGISVGEWSDANISDSFFLRTMIGTEVKDKSKVKANNLVYVDTKEKAINLYNKNKRYDTGGFLDAEYIYLLGNTKVSADKRSNQNIKNRVENSLPDLKSYKWHQNIQNTPYQKFLDEVKNKYAQ